MRLSVIWVGLLTLCAASWTDEAPLVLAERDFLAALESGGSSYRAEMFRLESEKALFAERKTWPNPEISYDRQPGGAPADIGAVTETTWLARQEIPLFTHFARARQFRVGASLTDAGKGEAALNARKNVRLAYAEAAALQGMAGTLEKVVESIAGLDRMMEERRKAGEASGYARLRVGVEVENLKTLHARTALALDAAKRALLDASGLSPAGAWRLAPLEAVTTDIPREKVMNAALSHPSLRAARALVELAEAERAEGAGRRFPEFSLYAGRKEAEDAFDSSSGNVVGFSLRVPVFNRGQRFRDAKTAEREEAQIRADLTEEKVMRDAEAAYAAYERWRAREAEHERSAASRAAELRGMARAAFEAGEFSVAEYLDAERAALEAALRSAEISLEVRKSWMELEAAAGAPLE